jgi:cytochrome c oxidase subunit 2
LEYLARIVTAGLLFGLAAAVLAGGLGWFGSSGRDIELVARQPTAGGWSQERIVVNQGEHVRLRMRSEDVVHGFAIGRMGVEAGPIEPGKVVTVEFVADQPGEFTYYCTMWCDPNHARMRGVLEVRGAGAAPAAPRTPGSDVMLQHLDDPRDAGVVPPSAPSAARGLSLYGQRCASCHGARGEGGRAAALDRRDTLAGRSPAALFRAMVPAEESQDPTRSDPYPPHPPAVARTAPSHAQYTQGWSEQERWDVVAAVWSFATTAERLDLGRRLYLKNCAACHGERGSGDGPGGRHQPKKPADFTDARRMLAGTTALYTAKIRRGGMGTGMPYWGSIFTEEELAALVDHIWSIPLDLAR